MDKQLTFAILGDDEKVEYAALVNEWIKLRDNSSLRKAGRSFARGSALMVFFGVGIVSYVKAGYHFIKALAGVDDQERTRLTTLWNGFFTRMKRKY